MSLFSQHPASAKYALKLTEILLYREGGISRFRWRRSKKGGVKTRKKPVKMSLFSQHPASAKYALKLTEILLYREGGISRYRGGHVAGDFIPRTPKSYEDAMTAETC